MGKHGTLPSFAGSTRNIAALVAVGAVVLSGTASAAQYDNLLVSRSTGVFGAAANGPSTDASVSADGRFVAFVSPATNLPGGSAAGQVFVRDVEAGTTVLASRRTGADGTPANLGGSDPSISADGRVVAFASASYDLSSSANSSFSNIYVRDLAAGTTMLASRVSGPDGVGAAGNCYRPALSADGKVVAFSCFDGGLAPNGANPGVYVRDITTDDTSSVSRATGADGAGATDYQAPLAISGDGRYVSFTGGPNLSATGPSTFGGAYVRDRTTSTTIWVGRGDAQHPAEPNDGSFVTSMSPDGRYVAFASAADNLVTGDDNQTWDVFLRDVVADTTTLVSRAHGAAGIGNDRSLAGLVSADGRYVAFNSKATNLTGDTVNQTFKVLLRDMHDGTTTLVNRYGAADGQIIGDEAVLDGISASGRFVTFHNNDQFLGTGTTIVLERDMLGSRLTVSAPPSFGEITIGSHADPQTILVTNPLDHVVQLGSAAIMSGVIGEFQLVNDGCSSVVLFPGDSCVIAARFAPSEIGARTAAAAFTNTLMFPGLAPMIETTAVRLSGTGIPPPEPPTAQPTGSAPATAATPRPPGPARPRSTAPARTSALGGECSFTRTRMRPRGVSCALTRTVRIRGILLRRGRVVYARRRLATARRTRSISLSAVLPLHRGTYALTLVIDRWHVRTFDATLR